MDAHPERQYEHGIIYSDRAVAATFGIYLAAVGTGDFARCPNKPLSSVREEVGIVVLQEAAEALATFDAGIVQSTLEWLTGHQNA